MKIYYSFIVIILSLFIGCKNDQKTSQGASPYSDETTLVAAQPLMDLLPTEKTGIDFKNAIIEDYDNNVTTNVNAYTGGGVCIADINNDNLPDLYFVCTNGPNKMYLNQGHLQFKDITAASGLSSDAGFESGAQAADVNGDGWIDFYVCRAGGKNDETRRNQLFINNKDLTFTEMGAQYGVDDQSASSGATFFDYDNDGDLDLYVINYPSEQVWTNKIDTKLGKDNQYHPNLEPRAQYDSDRFYRNDNGKFTDISKQAGIWNLAYGLSAAVSDFNRDGYLDIYVGNDFIQPDQLFINNQKGGFKDDLSQYLKHTSQHTMGVDVNDFDNDGWADLLALDMLPYNNARQKSYIATNTQSKQTALTQAGYFPPVVRNVLQHNNGNGTFSDVGNIAGIAATDWSWSGLLFDIDNDGLRDLHVTNGYKRDVTNRDFMDFTLPEIQKRNTNFSNLREAYPNFDDFLKLIPAFPKLRNFCYKNTGNMHFEDVSGQWMTMEPAQSFGAAWGDLDADGDLDLVTNNLEQPAFVYENKSAGTNGNNYLQLQLKGNTANTLAIGASALLQFADGQIQYAELFTNRGIFSNVEPLLHFGTGQHNTIDKITVRWPNGTTQTISNVPVNQRLVLQQSDATGPKIAHLSPTTNQGNTGFQLVKTLAFTHTENYYNDFETWPLNPWKITEMGPFTAAGDVNGDGLEDVFIGNGFEHTAFLGIQQPNGQFKSMGEQVFAADKLYEDHGAHFFDADMDKDLDLFVVSGGTEATSPAAWQGRLYINLDGKGNYLRAPNAIPPTDAVGSRVDTYDFDNDGDIDIFIGGRLTPGQWPVTPRSVILRNDRNKFTDVTAAVAPEFERCGMVSDLKWANVDTDPALELVVCGEWMPISVFKIENGKLVNRTEQYGLAKTNGLWNKLATGDLDGDGDLDIVTGNLGLNTRFKATEKAPFRCFAADFDKNSVLDPILASYEGAFLYPLVQKDVLVKHIPSLKKKYLKASDYCVATMSDVYPQEQLDAAQNLYCYELASCWWENKGGKFVRHVLPVQAQWSVNFGLLIADFNHDNHLDILLAGNKSGLEVETNACDAGIGTLLAGDGKGGFSWVNNNISGFWAKGEVRDLALIQGTNGKKTVVVANNNAAAQVYQF